MITGFTKEDIANISYTISRLLQASTCIAKEDAIALDLAANIINSLYWYGSCEIDGQIITKERINGNTNINKA